MKRLIAIFCISIFVNLGAPVANAASVEITVTEPSHRQIDGIFIDDELTSLLSYEGRLGQLVYGPPRGNRSWLIDPQLIEEVRAMTSDYVLENGEKGIGAPVAESWLNQLTAITRSDKITALPYGAPSNYWLSKLAPNKKSFYIQLGAKRLTAELGRQVFQMEKYPNSPRFNVDYLTLQAFKKSQIVLKINSEYMAIDEIEKFQAQSAAVLHPDLSKDQRLLLSLDLISSAQGLTNKIRLAPGRFTVTSTKQKLPITLINDFPNPAKLSIRVEASNGKVLVDSVPQFVVNGSSKVQVMIPVEVITSGKTNLSVSIKSDKDRSLGSEISYPVTLKVISPIATWVTTGGGAILFISALIQSFRRIRRKRL
jgi:hypothetical protein